MERIYDNVDHFLRSTHRESVEGKRMLTPLEILQDPEFSFPPTVVDRQTFFATVKEKRDQQNWFSLLRDVAKYKRVFPQDLVPGVDIFTTKEEEEDVAILHKVTKDRFGKIVAQGVANTGLSMSYTIEDLRDMGTVYPEEVKEWLQTVPNDFKQAMFENIMERLNTFYNGSFSRDAGIFVELFPEFTERVQNAVSSDTWRSIVQHSLMRYYDGDSLDRFIEDTTAALRLFPGRVDELQLRSMGEKVWKRIGDRQDSHRTKEYYFWHQAAVLAELMFLMQGEKIVLTPRQDEKTIVALENPDQVRNPHMVIEDPGDIWLSTEAIRGAEEMAKQEANERKKMQDVQSYFYAVFAKGVVHANESHAVLPDFKKTDSQGNTHRYTESFDYARNFLTRSRSVSKYTLQIAEVSPNYPQYLPPSLELDITNQQVRTIRFYWQDSDFTPSRIPNLDTNGELGKLIRNADRRKHETYTERKEPTKSFHCLEIDAGNFFVTGQNPGELRLFSNEDPFRADKLPKSADQTSYRRTAKKDLGYSAQNGDNTRYTDEQLRSLVHNLVQLVPTELRNIGI